MGAWEDVGLQVADGSESMRGLWMAHSPLRGTGQTASAGSTFGSDVNPMAQGASILQCGSAGR